MPYLQIDGIDGLLDFYSARGQALRPIIDEALRQSAEVIKDKLLAEEASTFKEPSGELGKTIALSTVGHVASAAFIDVYFSGDYVGRRGKARRAGLVAAMVEYKHKNPWNKRAQKKSKKQINSIIAEALSGGSMSMIGGLGGL